MRTQSDNNNSRQPNRLRFSQLAEYTSLAASVVGVVVSTTSKQVVYAAAPLSISLFLNLLNRQRFEQRTQQSLTTTATQVEQQLLQLSRDFSRLQQEVRNELNEQLQTLDARLTSSQQAQANLPSAIAQIEERLSQLTSSVSTEIQAIRQLFQSQADVVNPATLQDIQQGLSRLRERITAFESLNLGILPQNLAQLQSQFEQRFSQLQDSVFTLRQQLQSQESTPNPATLEIVRQELTQLQSQIASLESLNLRSVLQAIAQLQGQYNSLLESTSSLERRLERFSSREQVDDLQTEVEQLQTGLGQVQANLQQQHDNLQAEFAQLQTELQALIERLPSPIPPLETPNIPIEPFPSQEADSAIAFDGIGFDEQDSEIEIEQLDLNLGIDFGTSFTKVCFRDIGRNRSEVVTFSDELANLDEALLPTKIGILPDGTLLAGLTTQEWKALEQPIQTSVEFIKMRLADLDISQENERWRLEHLPELDRPETVENLCAYYLSRVIARAQSWIRRNKPDLVKNQKIEWSANVGVPVEYYDSPAIARFQTVLSLAWLLSNEPQTELLTFETLGNCLKQLRSRIEQNTTDCHAIPEISAAVWSFLNSREAQEGFYVFFDVGCGTLDGVSFRYWRFEGEPNVDFYSGSVKPLGVSALSKCIAAELNAPESEVRKGIFNQNDSYLTQMNTSQSRLQIQQLVGKVIGEGRQKHGQHRPVFKDLEFQQGLSVFLGGGGGKTHFYKQAIMDTHSAFHHKRAGIPYYTQKDIPSPKDLSMNGLEKREFHRFAIAYGLSIPEWDCPTIRLPSVMANAEPEETTPWSRPERYEDTRDS